jgi:hypothetical protein
MDRNTTLTNYFTDCLLLLFTSDAFQPYAAIITDSMFTYMVQKHITNTLITLEPNTKHHSKILGFQCGEQEECCLLGRCLPLYKFTDVSEVTAESVITALNRALANTLFFIAMHFNF